MPKAAKNDTAHWLLTGDEPEQDVRAQTANEQAVLRMLRAIPWEHQATALAAMEGIARGHRFERPTLGPRPDDEPPEAA